MDSLGDAESTLSEVDERTSRQPSITTCSPPTDQLLSLLEEEPRPPESLGAIRSLFMTLQSARELSDGAAAADPLHVLQGTAANNAVPRLSKGALSLVRASAARISTLEEESVELRAQLRGMEAQLAATRQSHHPNNNIDAIALKYQRDAEHQMMMRLKKRNDKLSAELSAAKSSVDTSRVDEAHRARDAAEARAAAAAREKKKLTAEVDIMRAELIKLQREVEQDVDARQKVSKLRAALDEIKVQKTNLQRQLEEKEKMEQDLKGRMARRENLLERAQARCRAAEMALSRFKAGTAGSSGTVRHFPTSVVEAGANPTYKLDNNESYMHLSTDLLASRLQEAAQLQSQALAAATEAAQERDELAAQVAVLTQRLQDAQKQLEEAAALAALRSKHDLSNTATSSPESSSSSDTSVPSLMTTPSAATMMMSGGDNGGQSHQQGPGACCTREECRHLHEKLLATQSRANSIQQQLEKSWELAEMSEQCASMEAELAARPACNDTDACVDSLRKELDLRTKEAAELSQLGVKANDTIERCMQELTAVSGELQEAKRTLASTKEELQMREQEASQANATARTMHEEIKALQFELNKAQDAAALQSQTATSALRAEREAAAADFHRIKQDMQALLHSKDQVDAQLTAAVRERDEAAEREKLAATRSAYHEQAARSKEHELQAQAASYQALSEEHRRLQTAMSELQRQAVARDCELQLDAERSQTTLQRRLSAMEAGSVLMQSQLNGAVVRADELQQRLSIEQAKVEDLENLLAAVRAEQFEREIATSKEDKSSHQNEPSAQQEADRLLDLLAQSDAECSRLKHEREVLLKKLGELETRADSSGAQVGEDVQCLREQVELERAQREEVEQRFQELVASLHNVSTSNTSGVQSAVAKLQDIAQGLHTISSGQ